MSLSSHQSAHPETTTWLTPPEIIEALGPFDLDPCAAIDQPWPTAGKHYTLHDNGLNQPWHGRVWLNPPFGNEAGFWIRRMADHGNGIALLPARTETNVWIDGVWTQADAILFMFRRPHFYRIDGSKARANSGAPIALIGYGEANANLLQERNGGCIEGALVREWS